MMIMLKALIYTVLSLLLPIAATAADSTSVVSGRMIPMNGVFLQPLQERDSVLIADQLLYGFELKQVEEGTLFALPEWENNEEGGVQAIGPWTMDTVKIKKQKNGLPRLLDIRAGMLITSFDEGKYQLPAIMVGRLSKDGVIDTLTFDPVVLEVKTMPVDTATFQPHDIKGQIRYPVTVKEMIPWVLGALLIGLLGFLAVYFIRSRRRAEEAGARKEPPHIIALRKLDAYRGNRLWVPEKQKSFYSGITDALREYLAARYEIGAMEMTTSEIFEGMKGADVPADLLAELRELFERADFVKFAKYVASEEENAGSLPVAVRFVTSTYQADLNEGEEGEKQEIKEEA